MAKPQPSNDGNGFRRIRLILSDKRKDEADFIAALDERNQFCGGNDHEFLRLCLLVGFGVMRQTENHAERLDTYTNQSQYTQIDTEPGSRRPEPQAEPKVITPTKVHGEGVRSMLGLLGMGQSSSEETV